MCHIGYFYTQYIPSHKSHYCTLSLNLTVIQPHSLGFRLWCSRHGTCERWRQLHGASNLPWSLECIMSLSFITAFAKLHAKFKHISRVISLNSITPQRSMYNQISIAYNQWLSEVFERKVKPSCTDLFIQGHHVQRNITPAFTGLLGIEGRNVTVFMTVEGDWLCQWMALVQNYDHTSCRKTVRIKSLCESKLPVWSMTNLCLITVYPTT